MRQRVDMPRLRDPSPTEFNELKRDLGRLMMEEQQGHTTDEMRLAAAVD
jgi:NitT/TauT family transport system ATP-binding protein